MTKLLLYIKGEFFMDEEIFIPSFTSLTFKDRVISKEKFVNAKAKQ